MRVRGSSNTSAMAGQRPQGRPEGGTSGHLSPTRIALGRKQIPLFLSLPEVRSGFPVTTGVPKLPGRRDSGLRSAPEVVRRRRERGQARHREDHQTGGGQPCSTSSGSPRSPRRGWGRGPGQREKQMALFFWVTQQTSRGRRLEVAPQQKCNSLQRRGRPPLRERARLSEGRGSPELGGLQPRGGAAQGCALHLGTARAGSPGHSRRPSAALAELPGQRRSVAVLVRFYSGEFRAL
ncbi:UBAP1-MVB12-associated (UMA)-domain containing protein 1 isoform X1 [Monodelphis domestica]|uniref:UBAP1-MVB12-associated (UMA)-domain containing protein 1 isoform X1 n=1 Tax=Monodelphis domestica TaxID=13616 RepID=UPI0024E19C43|nr:UBAP1-MVB12-associated (UMA)-domain containing protein 1 isoform X1 [Monodelphis domestica]